MLTCADIVKLVTDYNEGRLTPAATEVHLAEGHAVEEARSPVHPDRLPQEGLGLRQVALVDEDLGDVHGGHGRLDIVAGAQAGGSPPFVELQRLVP